MNKETTQIPGNQFMFAIACFLQASALLTTFIAGVTLQDSWVVMLFGAVLCLPLIAIYRSLMTLFPGRNLLQMLEEVYGPVAGKIIGVLYAWFFVTLSSLNLMDLGDFAKLTIMEDTPRIVLVVTCLAVAAWAVRYGIRVVLRYSMLFTITAFVILIAASVLVLNQIDLENFLPIFDLPTVKYMQGTHIITTEPFGEVVVFLMMAPNVKLSRRDITKYFFGGFALGVSTAVLVMLRDIAVLGNTLSRFTLPTLVTLRLVNMGVALSRIEILFAIVLIMLFFFKITFLYYVSVVTIAQLINVRRYRHIVLAVGALIISYGLTLYPSPVEHIASARETTPFIWTLFEILIPLAVLITAKLRKLPKTEEA